MSWKGKSSVFVGTTIEKQNRDLTPKATNLLFGIHHMKHLNENYPIDNSKGCTYTKEEVEMRKKHVTHEGVNSMKFYAQMVLPIDQEILQVSIHGV